MDYEVRFRSSTSRSINTRIEIDKPMRLIKRSPLLRSVLNSLLGALLLAQTAAFSQSFQEASGSGGWPFHDIVLDGACYRITRADSSISKIDGKTEAVGVTKTLPIPPSTALMRGTLRDNELLLFYGRREFVEGEEVEGSHTNGGVLVSLNPQTLEKNWHQEMPKYSDNLYLEGDALYVTFDDAIEKFDLKTRKRLWTQPNPGGPGWLSPRVDGATIIYPSRDEAINTPMELTSRGSIALETATGAVRERRWNLLKPTLFRELVWARKSAESEIQGFHSLRADTMSLEFDRVGQMTHWEVGQGVPRAKGTLPLSPGEKMAPTYVGVHSEYFYVFSQTEHRIGHLACVDRETLKVLWHHKIPGVLFALPGNVRGTSAVIVVDNKVQNIDLKTGKVLWENTNLPVSTDGSAALLVLDTPMVSGDRVIFSEAHENLRRSNGEVIPVIEPGQLVLDLKTGKVLERTPTKFAH